MYCQYFKPLLKFKKKIHKQLKTIEQSNSLFAKQSYKIKPQELSLTLAKVSGFGQEIKSRR